MRRWARWCGPTLCVLVVGRGDVATYLSRPMAAETRASIRAALEGFYRWAIDSGLRRQRSPFAGMAAVSRPMGAPRPAPDWVVAEGLAFADERTAAAIILARFAGLRAAEIAAVSPDDVTVDGRLQVRGKGDRVRLIPLHPQVEAVMTHSSGYVFASPFGGHWVAGTITHRVSAALPGPWTCHSLRHAFATECYRASGHDLRLVQQLLGHSSPRTTARYVLVDEDSARSIVTGLELIAQ